MKVRHSLESYIFFIYMLIILGQTSSTFNFKNQIIYEI